MDPVKSFSFSPTLYQMLSISISISIHFIHYDLFLSILSITLPKHLPTPIIRKVLVIPFHKIYDSNRCDRIIVVIFWVMPDIFQLRVVAYYARASPRDATGCKNLTPLLIGWIEWVSGRNDQLGGWAAQHAAPGRGMPAQWAVLTLYMVTLITLYIVMSIFSANLLTWYLSLTPV